ncbi:MAG: hypothetical protein GY841_21430 [FCB group bacterium]|nr:hypothetical protein [FCB group bacterium]
MKTLQIILVCLLGITLFLAACSGENKANEMAGAFLPEKSNTADIKKVSEVTTFAGETLFEYINGGAEIYHTYKFVEVATADYKLGEDDLVLDIYLFDNADYAFGLYSALRPPDPEFISLGVEGYISSTRLEILKDKYMIRLTAYKESAEISSAMKSFAGEIEKKIPGRTTRPKAFALFPAGEVTPAGDKLQAESYLGQVFLTDVYTREYQLGGVAFTVFLTEDSSGSKYDSWHDALIADGSSKAIPADLTFEGSKAFLIPESYYGQIITGIKGSRLVGIVGYLPEHQDFLRAWLERLER